MVSIINISLNFIFLFLLHQTSGQQSTCLTQYTNLSILGNDLNMTKGNNSDACCSLCQQNAGCVAYSWNDSQGGTCYLKNATQPLYNSTGNKAGIMSPNSDNAYELKQSYSASNFFDNFMFSHKVPTWGFANYTDKDTAVNRSLAYIQNGKVFMRVDNKTILAPNSTVGRDSVSIISLLTFDSGLFILDMDHMPHAHGLWPSYWCKGTPWPQNGEVDILEGIGSMDHNQISLHTHGNCSMQENDTIYFTGQWVIEKNRLRTNCASDTYTNGVLTDGCAIAAPKGTFNKAFNDAGGGVYAMEWDHEKYIKVWNFVRPNVPSDISKDNPHPNPDTWGLPTAYIKIGPNCTPDHFVNHNFIFGLEICGWAADDFGGGESVCQDFVRNHPEAFDEAYWLINYWNHYCRPNDPYCKKETSGTVSHQYIDLIIIASSIFSMLMYFFN